MSWYKIARAFTDAELWMHHGVDPQACREEFFNLKQKKKAVQDEASKKAESLGHKLFNHWGPLNSNRCRKCGMMVTLPNLNGQTSSPDIDGAAILNECHVNFPWIPENQFDYSDKVLDGGSMPLNKEYDTKL